MTAASGENPDVGWVEHELVAMAERLGDVRDRSSDVSPQLLVAELETAMEELRVTGEEIAAQQRHIGDLLDASSLTRATLERLLAAMPTPVLTTDAHGIVQQANPAAARLLGVAADRLAGKPLATYIDVADRRAVRTLLSQVLEGAPLGSTTVHVTPRGGGRHQVTLAAVPTHDSVDKAQDAGAGVVRWFADATSHGDGTNLSLLSSFAELVTVPSGAAAPEELGQRLVAIAQRAMPEVTDITITVGDPRKPERLTSSSARAQAADAVQFEVGEGPCVEAFLTDQLVASDHLDADPRWPTLARRILATGVAATIGVPIRDEAGVYGVLNLYGPPGCHLQDAGVRYRAELFARAASSLVQDSRQLQLLREESQHLRRALISRPEIDQAKGVLMARFGYSADDAFAHLVAVSQRRNVKLRDVAHEVVAMTRREGDAGDDGPPESLRSEP
jgi:PAS domain S-box-containing protein